ncbi:MAG: tyrosine-type recombinase/integrase [Candidatus Eremiobacterota bacterium]
MTGWEALIAGYLEHLAVRGRALRTRQEAEWVLRRFAEFCGRLEPARVELENMLAWKRELESGRSSWTVADRLMRVRSFFRWAHRRGLLLLDPTWELALQTMPRRLGRVLTVRQVEALLKLPDASTAFGLRDLAVLETFYGTGLRLQECHRLDLADLDRGESLLHVREGKGGRPRRQPLGFVLMGVLERYLADARPLLQPAPGESALFLSCRGVRLGRQDLGRIVAHFGRKAGLGRLSPHRLRHAYATHLLEGGADLRHIQVLMGHRSLLATEHYTSVRPVELFRMLRRYHPRARRKGAGPQLPAHPITFPRTRR